MSFDACAALVDVGDPERYRVVLGAPEEARAGLFALYAFNLEIARAAWVASEPTLAEIRLQWWANAIDEIRDGTNIRNHEVVAALAKTIGECGLDFTLLEAMIEARRHDAQRTVFQDERAVLTYIDATAGSLMSLALKIASSQNEDMAALLGRADGTARFLLALQELDARGRNPLAQEKSNAIIVSLAKAGVQALSEARRQRNSLPRKARSITATAWASGGVLKEALHHPARAMRGELRPSEFRRRLSLLYYGLLRP